MPDLIRLFVNFDNVKVSKRDEMIACEFTIDEARELHDTLGAALADMTPTANLEVRGRG